MHTDNACSSLYKELTVPDGIDMLAQVYEAQKSLQMEIFKRQRPDAYAAGKTYTSDKEYGQISVYYAGCALTEFFELCERIEKLHVMEDTEADEFERERVEAIYEYIDIVHFLMNVFIYAGVDRISSESTSKIYQRAKENYAAYLSGDIREAEQNLFYIWGALSRLLGEIINDLPFKNWKTYKHIEMKTDGFGRKQEALVETMIALGLRLGVTDDIFYNLYVTKRQENIERHEKGGIYAKTK